MARTTQNIEPSGSVPVRFFEDTESANVQGVVITDPDDPTKQVTVGANGAYVDVRAALPAGTNNIGDVDVVTQIGAANLANAQVTVDTTSGGVTIAAARATRRAVTIVNHGSTDVYVGAGTVSTANGFLLPGVKGAALTLAVTGAVKGIVASGSQVVSCVEEYD